jgi:hypothetical protein
VVNRRSAETERLALAALCAALPTLRRHAERGLWTDVLDAHVTAVEAGGSAVAACRELSLGIDPVDGPVDRGGGPADRGDANIDGAAIDWLPPPSLIGDYVCPRQRCDRRAGRDDHARTPRCGLSGEPMRFIPQDVG